MNARTHTEVWTEGTGNELCLCEECTCVGVVNYMSLLLYSVLPKQGRHQDPKHRLSSLRLHGSSTPSVTSWQKEHFFFDALVRRALFNLWLVGRALFTVAFAGGTFSFPSIHLVRSTRRWWAGKTAQMLKRLIKNCKIRIAVVWIFVAPIQNGFHYFKVFVAD